MNRIPVSPTDSASSPHARLPIVFMFSGQGSQYYWMGRELFDDNVHFRDALEHYDRLVEAELGESVLARIFDPTRRKSEPFTDTAITHPAIVMIELALVDMLRAEGIQPDYLLGSSLGEYAAATVSGSIDAVACLKLLVQQACCLQHGPRGGMLAVLAPLTVMEQVPELRRCDLAAQNYPGHFVVAGSEMDLSKAETALRASDILFQRVPVEYAYHSHLMDHVLSECRDAFAQVHFAAPRLPWLSCVEGQWVEHVTAEHFWRAARQPIQFELAMQNLREQGDFLYLDLGPSGTLHNFARNNLPPDTLSKCMPLLSPFGYDPDQLPKIRALSTHETPPHERRKATPMKVYGFPGQGSQHKGMGKELFPKFPELVTTADRILGYSIEELCLSDPQRRLGQTKYTQPALFVVSALSFLDHVRNDPKPADYLIGHSLGEYVALFAAGAFDFETGLRLVQRRGQLMAEATGGGMAAIIGSDVDQLERVLANAGLDGLDIANLNAPDQLVLSGPVEQIDAACRAAESEGVRAVRLNVSAPFHSQYMSDTANKFASFLEDFTFNPLGIPVLANASAAPYSSSAIKETLVKQIASPVRWVDTVRSLMGHGDFEFIEIGPGRVLTGLVARTRSMATALPPPVKADPGSTPDATMDQASETPPPTELRGPRAQSHATAPSFLASEWREDSEAVHKDEQQNGVTPPGTLPQATTTTEAAVVTAETLGAATFRERYGLRRAYLLGSLYGGISGTKMVGAAANAGLLGFLGTGGLQLDEVKQRLGILAEETLQGPFGVNVLYQHGAPEKEATLVDLLLDRGVNLIEASGFPVITPALVRFRLKGGRILAKISRTDVAAEFLSPPPQTIVQRLLRTGEVTNAEAHAATHRPMADDICAEADGGWVNSTADPMTLLPAVLQLRDSLALPGHHVHIGCAGSLGTPRAAAAAFLLGAEFILTGSVNQCSVEAATSNEVKQILQQAREYDVDIAPWGTMFEFGVKARYLKRSTFFPARASKLYELWRRHSSLSELDDRTRALLFSDSATAQGTETNVDPKEELTSAFRAYFENAFRAAVAGAQRSKTNYLIHCGPSMGAFNQLVLGTQLEPWQARTIEAISNVVMEGAADYIRTRLSAFPTTPESRGSQVVNGATMPASTSTYGEKQPRMPEGTHVS